MKLKGIKFSYTWVIIAMSILMVMISLGFTSSTRSLFPDEISKDLGVERSLVSIGESLRYIATAVVNIFFGFLIAKFGPKKLICFGFIMLIASMLLYAYAPNVFVIYIGGTLLGIGLSFTATTMVGYIVGMWCSKNKGTIMGAVLASNGIGGAIAIVAAGKMINPDVVGSYRSAYKMIAIVLAVTLLVLFIFFKDKKQNDGEENTEENKKAKKRGMDWSGIDISVAVRRFYFWGAIICIFFSGVIIQGTSGIVKMHMTDVGINYDKVLALLSFGSIVLASAKFLTGFIYDRGGLRVTATWCTVIAIISSFLLAFTKAGSVGFVLAVIYNFLSQFAVPLETVMLPIYAADLFGKKSYPKILGIFVSVNTAGYAVSAPLMNLCYDIFGSYVPALYLVGFIMIGVLVLLQFVISTAHREQKKVLSIAS